MTLREFYVIVWYKVEFESVGVERGNNIIM